MSDVLSLQQLFENFNMATASLKQAYANLEIKFENINRELEIKNMELENTIAEKEEMKNYLQNILESLTNGVIVTDLEGKIQRVNRCACIFAGVEEAVVRGKHVSALFDLLSPENWEGILFSEYLKGGVGHKIKLNGRTMEIFSSPVTARNGETLGNVFILRDITRIERLEEMEKRSEKFASMGEMAANIAHEIRNPLGSIELFASLLMKDLKEKRDKDRVTQIVSSVKNMDNKISNLLLFTKTKTPRLEVVNINEVLKETLIFAEQLASQGSISLDYTFEEGEVHVACDVEMMKQVFLNIIFNGIQAMPDGGNLHIETKFSNVDKAIPNVTPFVEIMFKDSGIGIPEENLPKIFDPFFSTKEGTSGLGLPIVHNIIDMHNGAVHVESGQGGGTVFSVLLPYKEKRN
ncbi:MAG: two-component system sensor histidine kinase NtrB [Syntrophales bacterium]